MRKLEAVLWDMDGTLVDSEDIAVEALYLAMAEAGLTGPPDLKERVVGRASDEIYQLIVEGFGLNMDPLEWEKRKHHHYFKAASALKAFDEALETWHRLDASGIHQAVVSNSDRAIVDINLRAAGLLRPGLITISRNDVRKGKPEPEGYLRAAYLLGVAMENCLVVEDSTSGAIAGLASGMETVFVPHSIMPAPTGVRQLHSLRELEEHVFA
ncbi:HAD family phosphatase [Ensifer sp. YR511]|uniref:HAD family hydrolase n=1 Tax=Ensifer sp. YR511 TaxID=1855294 RepID=UPI0008869378|nr:HAD family phosphatase [Ensifer sp. YR511]SDN04558.1 haloacid dehalogenase superfamily, subfamily IA, variant 3 with third motif having DD or ED [Ensifer sp. YR511]